MNAKAAWSVLVVYDSPETREAAVSFCDQLVQRFWHELEFDVSWWATERLRDPDSGQHASRRAAEADLVIVALPPADEVPIEVQEWVETWADRRPDREGALLGLVASSRERKLNPTPAEKFLRQVAHRAGMDYLTQLPSSIGPQMPESIESCVARAQEVTSVLDEILRQQPPPPRLL